MPITLFSHRFFLISAVCFLASDALAGEPTSLQIDPAARLQKFQGMGCGAIFYEAHATSFEAAGKSGQQAELYDAMFRDVRTDFLQLMIRHDHEPQNDNADPFDPKFKPEWFDYAKHAVALCKAARERNPDIRFYATLYSPPPWMKTNNDSCAGGADRATIKPNMEDELGEYCWAFLAHMRQNGYPIEFLSIANEPDWPHEQPGYNLTAPANAALTRSVSEYLDEMAVRFPEVPRPRLVGPNTLSAVSCAETWLPLADAEAKDALAVVGTHDYDRRGTRFSTLRKLAGHRPLWVTEWCVNGTDQSPGLINSAGEYWLAMSEAFNQGVNTWMAYDWVYPPRDGGEALIHVNWGKDWTKTKIYHGFQQWCAPLVPGMSVVRSTLNGPGASGISKPGIKACAFLSEDGKRLVAHVANVQDKDMTFTINPGQGFARAASERTLTSHRENLVKLPVGEADAVVELPGRSLNTWVWIRK